MENTFPGFHDLMIIAARKKLPTKKVGVIKKDKN